MPKRKGKKELHSRQKIQQHNFRSEQEYQKSTHKDRLASEPAPLKNISQNSLLEQMHTIRLVSKRFETNSKSNSYTKIFVLGSENNSSVFCYNVEMNRYQRFNNKINQDGIFICIPKRKMVTFLFIIENCLYLQELNEDTLEWIENSKQLIDDCISATIKREKEIKATAPDDYKILKCIPIFNYLIVVFTIDYELLVKIYKYNINVANDSLVIKSKQLVGSKIFEDDKSNAACIFYKRCQSDTVDINNCSNCSNYEISLFGGKDKRMCDSFCFIKLSFDNNGNFVEPTTNAHVFDDVSDTISVPDSKVCRGWVSCFAFHSFSYDLFEYGLNRLKFVILTGGILYGSSQDYMIVFDFQKKTWTRCRAFALPNRICDHSSIVLDKHRYHYKPKLFLMGGKRLRQPGRRRGGGRFAVFPCGINWKIDLSMILDSMGIIQTLKWEHERIIWIAFHKNVNNDQCLLSHMPKDIIETIILLLIP